MTRAAAVIQMRSVDLGYTGAAPVLRDVTLDVAPGEVVAFVGESGAGKTTLLKAVAGLLQPRAGELLVLDHAPRAAENRGRVGYVPQRLGLVQHASALENVLIGGLHREPTWRNVMRAPSAGLLEEARLCLEKVGIGTKADAKVRELSGGQQRRVAVARALLQRPAILLADEFLSELDRKTADVVEAAVLELSEMHGTCILLVEHHVDKARTMADRVFSVNQTSLVDITDVATARTQPPVDEADRSTMELGESA